MISLGINFTFNVRGGGGNINIFELDFVLFQLLHSGFMSYDAEQAKRLYIWRGIRTAEIFTIFLGFHHMQTLWSSFF